MCCHLSSCDQTEVIARAIEALVQRSLKIKAIIYANPYQEILQLREQVKSSVCTFGYTASVALITASTKRERELMALIRKQKKHSSELILELTETDMEIDELKKELSRLLYPSLLSN